LHEGLIEPALAAVRNGIAGGTELPAATAADKSAHTYSCYSVKQKSHAQYAESTFLQDGLYSVFRFYFG
jgi:hypothetical protein